MLNESELINHPSPNYSRGRNGTPVRHITFHHVVGSAKSALARFDKASEQASAHFVVGADAIYCCVNTDDTAWTNGNWNSNLESVTIEHEGDWRFGFRSDAVINNSARLVAWLRSLYPDATPMRHRDISATACPGDLPVEEIWQRASAILSPPPPPAPAPEPTPIIVNDPLPPVIPEVPNVPEPTPVETPPVVKTPAPELPPTPQVGTSSPKVPQVPKSLWNRLPDGLRRVFHTAWQVAVPIFLTNLYMARSSAEVKGAFVLAGAAALASIKAAVLGKKS